MKRVAKVFTAIGLLLLALLVFYLYASGRAEQRARFINLMSDLKEAHMELQQYGGFTNHFRYTSVYTYTNHYAISGTNYQCEFAAENEEFRDRGILVITTNQVFVWIDKTHGVIPLLHGDTSWTFPPGI